MSFTHVTTSHEAICSLANQIKDFNTEAIIALTSRYNNLYYGVVSDLYDLITEIVRITVYYKKFIEKPNPDITVLEQFRRTERALQKIEALRVRILPQRLKVEEELKKMSSRVSFVEAESKKYAELVKQLDVIPQPKAEQKRIDLSGLYRCTVSLKNEIDEIFSMAREAKAEVEEKVKHCEKQFEASLLFVRDNERNQHLIRERAHFILNLRNEGSPALSSSSFSIHNSKREGKPRSLSTETPERPQFSNPRDRKSKGQRNF